MEKGTITWTDIDDDHTGFTHFIEVHSGSTGPVYRLFPIRYLQSRVIRSEITFATAYYDAMERFVAKRGFVVARPE